MEYTQFSSTSSLTLLGINHPRPPAYPKGTAQNHLPTTSNQSNEQAAIVRVDNTAFTNRLEKHIHDYYRGEGNLSREVSADLSERQSYAASALDPKNSLNFGAYATVMTYGQRSRYTANIAATTAQTGRILNAAG